MLTVTVITAARHRLPVVWLIVLAAAVAVFADPVSRADDRYESHAVVFMYHRFGESEYRATSTRLDQFDAQLAWLNDENFHVWPLARILEYLAAERPIPDRTIAITVDDAYLSVYQQAYPRLKTYGWPFTIFVSTDAVDEHLPSYMSWDQMREMKKAGAEFANHSATHDHLLERHPGENEAHWRRRITLDINKAAERLRDELNSEATLFAYPYGEFDSELADLVAGLGYTAFGQQSGVIARHADPRALPRYPIAEAYGELSEFRTKAQSLPLPVISVTPWDPVVHGRKTPRMEVGLGPSDARLDELACYGVDQQRLPVVWIEREPARFAVQAVDPIPLGRSRYNCTAPSAQSDRYYWFSHPWLRRP